MLRKVPNFPVVKLYLLTFTFAICLCVNTQAVGQPAIDQNSASSTQPTPTIVMAEEQLAQSFVSVVIHWVVVPSILLTILLYGCTLPGRTTNPSVRTTGSAGIFAGFIVFIIFVVSQQKRGLTFSLEVPVYSFDLLGIAATVGGIVLGFVVALIVDAIKQYRAFGFVVLFIVATTTTASYGYFFIKDVRSIVVFMSLGIMLGALLHIMCFPETIAKFSFSARYYGEDDDDHSGGKSAASTSVKAKSA